MAAKVMTDAELIQAWRSESGAWHEPTDEVLREFLDFVRPMLAAKS